MDSSASSGIIPNSLHSQQFEKNEPSKGKIIGFAIAIILSIAVLGVGVGGCLGCINSLSQPISIVMVVIGGGAGIGFSLFWIISSVKNCSQKKQQQISGKIVPFADKTPLYDRTAAKVVTIAPRQLTDLVSSKTKNYEDEIYLGGRKVVFLKDLNGHLIFSGKAKTDHVIVEDDATAGVYKITEVQTNGLPQKQWVVDTNKKFQIVTQGGPFEIGMPDDVYLVESEVPDDFASLPPQTPIGEPARGIFSLELIKFNHYFLSRNSTLPEARS